MTSAKSVMLSYSFGNVICCYTKLLKPVFIVLPQADSERSETSALKRENQSLLESCDSLEKARQKLGHDLGVKEQQVSSCTALITF